MLIKKSAGKQMRKLTDKITIFRTDFGYLKALKKSMGLPNYAETVHHIVKLAEIQVSVNKGVAIERYAVIGNASSPIIADSLKEKQLAPTKNNEFIQIGGEKL